jgi:hypothetical protein
VNNHLSAIQNINVPMFSLQKNIPLIKRASGNGVISNTSDDFLKKPFLPQEFPKTL